MAPTNAQSTASSSQADSTTSAAGTTDSYILTLVGDTKVPEIVRKNSSGGVVELFKFDPVVPPNWTVDALETAFTSLETSIKEFAPATETLQLNVVFDQVSFEVTLLRFQRHKEWQYGPTLVLSSSALSGLSQLKTLEIVNFNLDLSSDFLPSAAAIDELSFDKCEVPSFTLSTKVSVTNVYCVSELQPDRVPIGALGRAVHQVTLKGNRIERPITMTSAQFTQLQSITFENTGNTFMDATTASTSAAITSTSSSSSACENPQVYQEMTFCILDLTYRTNKDQIIKSDSSGSSSSTTTKDTAASSGSNKLMTSIIVILSVCSVAIVVIGSIIYRKRQRAVSYSGDTRSSFYENSDMLLSPSKLDPKSQAVGDDIPVPPTSSSAVTTPAAANTVGGNVADLDLGREVIHLGKKLGIHGLRKGEYRDEPVVALRVSLRELRISMREVNKIIASYVPFRHRNIVELLGTSMTALEDLLIVVEYMGKGSLRSVLRNPKIDLKWHDKLRMSTDICAGIDFVHSVRSTLVSKNLTSKSVLCNNELTCKLDIFDYGRNVRDHSIPVLNFGECDIASRAPEVLTGGPITRAAEVYALGVIFCEISSRKMPFEEIIAEKGPTLGDLLIAREVAAQRLELKPAREDVPVEYQELAIRCVAFDPSRRPTVSEILSVLRA
ncbi:Tkl protein kinase, partial [Globisporangium splendens]